MNARMMKNFFPKPLTVVMVLILLIFYPLWSFAVNPTPEQPSDKITKVLPPPATKQGLTKSSEVKKVAVQTKTTPAAPDASLENVLSFTPTDKKKTSPQKSSEEANALTNLEPKVAGGKFAPPETIIYPILHYQVPRAERIVLANGMILFLLEDHELPLVSISTVFRTGSAYDPPGKEGLAELTGRSMRTGGTAALTADEIDDQLDRYAINIWTTTDMEMSRLGLNTLKENLEKGMDLFSQVLKSPRFEPGKVQTEKDLIIEGLRRIEDDPQEYAFREFRRHLYQGNSRGSQKTIPSVDKLQVSDLADFHQKYFSPGNMMITVTGDINREEALQLLTRYFGSSIHTGNVEPLPAPVIRGDGKTILVPKETPQSIVLMGFSAPTKKSTDYFAFSLLDFVLGSGGFRSRIFQEIRNNQGLAYSAGSFYKAREDYGVLSTYGMTKSDSTMKVLNSMKAIVAGVGHDPFKSEEINWAKKAIINNFLFSFVSAEQIAYQQMMIEYEGLPSDFLLNYRDKIQEVKIGDVNSLAEKYLRLDQATVLILGDEKHFDRSVNPPETLSPGN
jgi:zinc protease